MVGGSGRAVSFAMAGAGAGRGGGKPPAPAEAGVDGAAGDVVGRGERPRAGADGVGDRVDERRGAVAPNHVNVVGSGGGADGSAEWAVAVVDEAAVVAHGGVGKDDAGNAEVDEVLDEGVEAGLRGGAGRGVAVPGGNVVVVETEG